MDVEVAARVLLRQNRRDLGAPARHPGRQLSLHLLHSCGRHARLCVRRAQLLIAELRRLQQAHSSDWRFADMRNAAQAATTRSWQQQALMAWQDASSVCTPALAAVRLCMHSAQLLTAQLWRPQHAGRSQLSLYGTSYSNSAIGTAQKLQTATHTAGHGSQACTSSAAAVALPVTARLIHKLRTSQHFPPMLPLCHTVIAFIGVSIECSGT